MPDPGVDDEKKKARRPRARGGTRAESPTGRPPQARIERFKDPAAAAEEAKRLALRCVCVCVCVCMCVCLFM